MAGLVVCSCLSGVSGVSNPVLHGSDRCYPSPLRVGHCLAALLQTSSSTSSSSSTLPPFLHSRNSPLLSSPPLPSLLLLHPSSVITLRSQRAPSHHHRLLLTTLSHRHPLRGPKHKNKTFTHSRWSTTSLIQHIAPTRVYLRNASFHPSLARWTHSTQQYPSPALFSHHHSVRKRRHAQRARHSTQGSSFLRPQFPHRHQHHPVATRLVGPERRDVLRGRLEARGRAGLQGGCGQGRRSERRKGEGWG